MNKKLQIEQLDRKVSRLGALLDYQQPPKGWINTIRVSLNMSLRQLAERMGKTPATVKEIELREQKQSITIKKMVEIAEALDCKFVYGIVPKEGTFADMVEKRAEEIATEIVQRSSNSMALEDQENTTTRIQQAISDRVQLLKLQMPRCFWDQSLK